MWNLLEWLATILDALLGVSLVMGHNEEHWSENKWSYLCFLLICVENILSNWYTAFSPYDTYFSILVLIFLGYRCKGENVLYRILPGILFYLYLTMVNTSVLLLCSWYYQEPLMDIIVLQNQHRLLGMVLAKGFLILITFFLWRNRVKRVYLHLKETVIILSIPTLGVAMMTRFMELAQFHTDRISMGAYLGIVLGIFLMNLLSYFLVYQMTVISEAHEKVALALTVEKKETKFYQDLKNLYEEQKILRHDIQSMLGNMSSMMKEQKYAQVCQWIEEINNSSCMQQSFIHVKQEVVNYIVNMKLSEAYKARIDVQVLWNEAEDIAMESVDLMRILGNVLDNALEAAKKSEKRRILLERMKEGGYDRIQVRNSIKESVLENNQKLHTTKTERKNHGYGMKSIYDIVKRYDGMIDIYEENLEFCIVILIPHLEK